MGSIDKRRFYQHYVNAINNHDFNRMEAFYSRSIRFRLYDTVQNFDALIVGLQDLNRAFPDWRWQALEVLFDGELITARYADTGTHMGVFQGVEPTGRKVNVPEFAVYRIADDRIDEMWSSLDIREVIRQIS
jgi:predicted ester cyclase